MPVSSWLQKYFDSQRSQKKGDTSAKLDAIMAHVDPVFMQSFQDFRSRILDIVDDNQDCEDIIHDELNQLEDDMEKRKRLHDMKKLSTYINHSENKK